MLAQHDQSLAEQRCVVSGAGNVAIYTVEKLLVQKAQVLTLSDSGGVLLAESGLNDAHLATIKQVKEVERGRLKAVADAHDDLQFRADEKPWAVACDVAIPAATQNELDESDAQALCQNGVQFIAEAANMPLTAKATDFLLEQGVVIGPSKAVNAGGVAVSGLERTQNALMQSWSAEQVDNKLQDIMAHIHQSCVTHGEQDDGRIDYIRGANIAGFVKVADAMLFQGLG
jgi:glutamate dehydrogenase (NADP+)